MHISVLKVYHTYAPCSSYTFRSLIRSFSGRCITKNKIHRNMTEVFGPVHRYKIINCKNSTWFKIHIKNENTGKNIYDWFQLIAVNMYAVNYYPETKNKCVCVCVCVCARARAQELTDNRLTDYWILPQPSVLPANETSVPNVLIADQALPLTSCFMKWIVNQGSLTNVFNYRLTRTRRITENAFGLFASVFKTFRKPLNIKPTTAKHIKLACVICFKDSLQSKYVQGVRGQITKIFP
jgi:hypothetical protein